MKKTKLLTFRDNKGNTVRLPDDLTMEDLVKLGIQIKLQPKGSPLPDNWYAHPPARTAQLLAEKRKGKTT